MKICIPLRFLRLAAILLAASTLVYGEDDSQEPGPTQFEVNEAQLRKEIETAKEIDLDPPWNDQTTWKMTDYYPPAERVSAAYKTLRAAGCDDLVEQGAIYYAIGEKKHLLLITSTASTPVLAKYYCVAFDDEGEARMNPIKVWVKYREVIHKFTNTALDQSKKAEQDGTGQPATRPESKSEGGDKPQPEAEGRPR